ncbi:MAG TPA: hypothetical protein VK982_00350 [Bacteroidales bacterium]|nr:hypothetical protein [Bacteroidales bacterium]
MARKVRIEYEHCRAANAHMHRKWWTGYFTDTGEGYDYNTKESLIEDCKKEGYEYEVIRHHRNGTTSVVERG